MPSELSAVVMAAGLGTRMRSATPKHLHTLLGRRMVDWVIEAVKPLGASPLVVVTGPDTRGAYVDEAVEIAVQHVARGTGDAVAAARSPLSGFGGDVLVVPGDAPLLTTELLSDLVEAHRHAAAEVTVLSFEPPVPLPYGRVLHDESGALRAIVEEADATPADRAVTELNGSVYVFRPDALWNALERLDADNAQGELYLTDTIAHIVRDGGKAAAHRSPDATAPMGVNTLVELADAVSVLRGRVNEEHMLAGVTIVDPGSTWIEPTVEIEPDAVIEPSTHLRGRTRIAGGARVGPEVVAVDAVIGAGALVGPFCYLRPGTVLGAGSKAGTFVEIKNSHIGEGVKVPHCSYIGDADIGEGTNVAAGNITVNFPHEPGKPKSRTRIGRNVRTGVQNAFVAPVEIGDDAWIGAGSVITEDVPPGALAIARARQVNKEGRGGKRHDDDDGN
jgi:bifunctional UDP-N-acetylglucosamine pyrophosphorylase / glucosamine-1-phosphate N-acetyltransferase